MILNQKDAKKAVPRCGSFTVPYSIGDIMDDIIDAVPQLDAIKAYARLRFLFINHLPVMTETQTILTMTLIPIKVLPNHINPQLR